MIYNIELFKIIPKHLIARTILQLYTYTYHLKCTKMEIRVLPPKYAISVKHSKKFYIFAAQNGVIDV